MYVLGNPALADYSSVIIYSHVYVYFMNLVLTAYGWLSKRDFGSTLFYCAVFIHREIMWWNGSLYALLTLGLYWDYVLCLSSSYLYMILRWTGYNRRHEGHSLNHRCILSHQIFIYIPSLQTSPLHTDFHVFQGEPCLDQSMQLNSFTSKQSQSELHTGRNYFLSPRQTTQPWQ